MLQINPQLNGKTNVEFNKQTFPHLYGTSNDLFIEKRGDNIYVETTLSGDALLRKIRKYIR